MGAIILIISEDGDDGCGENDNDFVFAQLIGDGEEVTFMIIKTLIVRIIMMVMMDDGHEWS